MKRIKGEKELLLCIVLPALFPQAPCEPWCCFLLVNLFLRIPSTTKLGHLVHGTPFEIMELIKDPEN